MIDPVTAARLHAAEARASKARDRLAATAAELRARLDPKALVETAKREASEKTVAAARASAKAAMLNPGATAGAVAGVGLFLARHRLFRLFRRKPNSAAAAMPAQPSLDLPPPPPLS